MDHESVAELRLQISRLESENEAIREERDRFRIEVKTFRSKVNVLESQAEDLEIQNGDLKRKLSRIETLPPVSKADEMGGSSRRNMGTLRASTKDIVEVEEDLDTEGTVVPSQTKSTKSRPPLSSKSSTRSSTSWETPIVHISRHKRAIDTVDDAERPIMKAKKTNGIAHRKPPARVSNTHQDDPSSPPTPIASPETTPAKPYARRPSIRGPKHPRQGFTTTATGTSTSTSVPPRFIAKRREGLKVEADSLILPSQYLLKYLGSSVPLPITPPPPSPPTLLKRTFICQTLGGNSQTLRTSSNYRGRQILFPTLDNNPDAPIHPGSPGLMGCSRVDVVGAFTVFSRVQVKPNPMWEYMGEYRTSHIGLLPASIFDAQTREVKDAWAKTIDLKTWPPYPDMRARIAARKGGELTRADIIEALEQGDEQIGLLKMECVSYDREFLAHLTRKLKTWGG
ncbi:hypothetical protein BDZ94DRAFT_531240 [Collybia nuda]|uniref:DUF6697 domain-containing protein n=1 Tax=Collybia nuda TaxID=64659 RepID=A0A9P5Y877_9AGAR|nr:hypothetical protein BDZ94DRAFT_531240 [Collybia nuda]